MPVTARLSRRFYDTFGEEIANELVDWFNAVDLTYRADLRELNELNFARFDAKLEQRIAQSEARMERRLSELDAKIDRGLVELEAKVERRLAELDTKIDRVAAELDAKIDRMAAELDAKIDRVAAELRADLLKWMFLFWLGTVGPILALLWPIATR